MKLASFLIPVSFALFTFVSCSKSGSGSKPTLSIESITTSVDQNGQLDVKFKFSKGSNVSNGSLAALRFRINELPATGNITLPGDTLNYPIPEYNNVDKGELEYTQPYSGYLHFSDGLNDTLLFKFALITSSGVSSDTITSPKVIVINP